jgi:hypothetical protein
MFWVEPRRWMLPRREAAFSNTFPVNSLPRSVITYFGAPKVLATTFRSLAMAEAPGFFSYVETARGDLEKASKTEAM